MNFKKIILRLSVALVILIVSVTSCRKDENGTVYQYFVSKELTGTFSKSYINNLVSLASASIPGIGDLKSLMVNDVNIYKTVYKTSVNGEQIEASGLVCVPATPGEYPVLSFQNGTNTVNALAPSEFPLNYSYQLIEIIASMGYIVVIPDYPGFGASSQIPHPYLIKESTIRSLIDMHYAVREMALSGLKGITLKNEYYLVGYSQGGWATLGLHKAMELDYSDDFNLKGSACGAGPYDIYLLLQEMVTSASYPMPVYLGYILNAYTAYGQFTNPVSDIFNEPYASRLNSLYTGNLGSNEINARLTTSISGLINHDFLSGFASSEKYASIRDALNRNSITAWHSYKPLLLMHGDKDTSVDPVTTANIYAGMIAAGTSPDICKKVIIPGAGHSEGIAPFVVQSILFLRSLNSSK